MGPPYRFHPLGVGQPQVQEDHVNGMLRKIILGLTHALHVHQLGVLRSLFVEHLTEQTSVSGVIFDQENCFDRYQTHIPSLRRLDLGQAEIVGSVSVWSVVAAVSDRRNQLNRKPAVRDRRYSKPRHYQIMGTLDAACERLHLHGPSRAHLVPRSSRVPTSSNQAHYLVSLCLRR